MRDWIAWYKERLKGFGLFSLESRSWRKDLPAFDYHLIRVYSEGGNKLILRMQVAMDASSNKGNWINFSYILGRNFSCWWWWNTLDGTQRTTLWNLHPWGHSNLHCTVCWASCCPALSTGPFQPQLFSDSVTQFTKLMAVCDCLHLLWLLWVPFGISVVTLAVPSSRWDSQSVVRIIALLLRSLWWQRGVSSKPQLSHISPTLFSSLSHLQTKKLLP